MKMKYMSKLWVILLCFATFQTQANPQKPIQVVTSFSILENLVQELGGERVQIINLVGRNSDAHIYQPKPSDAVAISKADLVVMNGLGFEGWITRLMDQQGYKNRRLIASHGVEVLKQDEETDPHAWQSFENINIYVENITKSLIEIQPQHKGEFIQRQSVYMKDVNVLRKEMLEKMNQIPLEKRRVITSHDAFGYLGKEFQIQFIAPVGLSTDAEPTAADVAAVIDQILQQKVKAMFVENISNPRLLQQISAETGVENGGALYSDALSETHEAAPTYLKMMRHNLEALAKELK